MRWPHTIFIKSSAPPPRMAGRRTTYRNWDRPKAYLLNKLTFLIVYELWKSAVPGRNPALSVGRPAGGRASDPAISASRSREYHKIL